MFRKIIINKGSTKDKTEHVILEEAFDYAMNSSMNLFPKWRLFFSTTARSVSSRDVNEMRASPLGFPSRLVWMLIVSGPT